MMQSSVRKALKKAAVALAFYILVLAVASLQPALAGVRGLFVGDDFISNLNPTLVANTKVSGYNTIIIFEVNVNPSGDLTGPNGELLVHDGVYVGNSSWGAQLASLKAEPTGINRIEMALGGWGGPSFPAIQSLVNSQGTGSGSILYQNFLALHNATNVDAIDFDDETTYDLNTSVPFGRMLNSLGMWVTLCPYQNESYWVSLLADLGPFNAYGGCVDAVYLQCYDGGAGNNPASWVSGFSGFNKVYPGVWTNVETLPATGLSTVTTKMRNWQNSCGINGGFIWNNTTDPPANDPWSLALANGLDTPYFNIISGASGGALDLANGSSGPNAVVDQWANINGGTNQYWSLLPTAGGSHFEIVAWATGQALGILGASTSNGAQTITNNYAGTSDQQWDLIDAGSGLFNLRNVKSGLMLDLDSGSTANGAKTQQWQSTGGVNQLWRLQPTGSYYIRAASGKYINVAGAGTANGSTIIQYNYQTNPWFQWNFNFDSSGWYGLRGVGAPTSCICLINGSYSLGADCDIWNDVGNPDQRIRIEPKLDGNFKFYFSHTGYSWDMSGATGNGVPLEQWSDDTNPWQEFALERIPSTNVLYQSTVLLGGQGLSCGTHTFIMQTDGNLVEYNGTTALWASGTSGNSGAYCTMQSDGNLVVYSSSGAALWASGTPGNSAAYVTLQSDGNVVVYSYTNTALWSTGTAGR